MKQSCVSAFTRAARYLALTAVVLATGASTLFAQAATGKIEGKVRDQQGAPIANVQVIIIGSKFGAQTNADGYYFINLVPAGNVTLQASFIGYKKTQITDLRVLSGQTITADITMESTPVEVQEITVVAAQNELVPRDAVTTKQNVQGNYTEKLPVDQINNALALQPGVVASTGGTTLSIRGGRTDEQAVYVDGVPVGAGNRGGGFVTGGGNSISIGTNGFEDASVTTGAGSAAFGGAQSGIISISTRTGGDKFTGAVGFESDGLFGNSVSLGFNRITASLGGPIVNNLSFFVSGVLAGAASAGTGQDRANSPYFTVAGVDTVVAVPDSKGNAVLRHDVCHRRPVRRVHRQVRRDHDVRRHQHPEQHQPRHRQQLRGRLPGHPAAGYRQFAVPAAGQAQLHVRHRFAHLPQREREPGAGAELHLRQPVQPAADLRQHRHQPGLHPRVDAEPGQVVGAGAGARRLPLVPDGRVHHLAADPGVGSRQPEPVGRLHDLAAQVPVQLRQLPAEPGVDGQLPAEQGEQPALSVRPGEHRAVQPGRQVAEQRLRPHRLHRSRRPDRPADHEPGKPVHRRGGPRLAGGPLQPPQDRWRLHRVSTSPRTRRP